VEAGARSHSRVPIRAACLILGVALSAGAAPQEIRALLDQAAGAMAARHYVYPASGSAMALYREVLVLDPGNSEAAQGLERLVEHFLQEAAAAIDQERYGAAETMLSRARMVDPEDPDIAPLETQLELLENATRHEVHLDWRKVAARSPELTPVLVELGRQARREGCRAVITVSNDSEARWVYEQLSQAPGERRIQAQVRIASPSAVAILCF